MWGWQNTLTEAALRRVPSRPVSRVVSVPSGGLLSDEIAIPWIRGAGGSTYRCHSRLDGGKGKCGRAREADLKRAGMVSRSLPWTALVPTDCTGIGGGPEEQTRPAAHPASLAPSTSLSPLAGSPTRLVGAKTRRRRTFVYSFESAGEGE